MFRLLMCMLMLTATGLLALAGETSYLQGLLDAARPGQTVTLPAGEFRGGATVPPGVSLKGAGWNRTILDAGGAQTGLMVAGSGSVISDMTVRGAVLTDILVQDVERVTLRRLRATAGLIGVSVKDGHGVRIENVISDGNRYGIVISGGEGNAVVNCTAANNISIGFSFPSGKRTVAFNNLSTESVVAVNVGNDAEGITLDYNLYTGLTIGKSGKNPVQRETMSDWQYVSGLDMHSVSIPVQFDNPAVGRFAVTNTLDWSPDRTVTSGWGTAKLAGVAAPSLDINGVKRPGAPGLGAFETASTAPRPAEGTFTVPAGNGLVSAGVFTPQGKLVAYLFNTMPIPAGTHKFWLPARTYDGKPIEAGQYEVRVVKGDLEWKYVGWFGNTERKDADGYGAPCSHTGLTFDKEGRLFVGNVASDVFKNLRCADAKGQWLWTLTSVSPQPGPAMAVAADGALYVMRTMAGQGMCLTRIEPASGRVLAEGTAGGQISLPDGATYTSMSALGKTLCYTDTAKNAVRFGTLDVPVPAVSAEVDAPTCVAADVKTGVAWAISGGEKLVAVSPDGKVVATAQPVPSPVALAVRDGLLAVASTKTGKVHLFDASNPNELTLLRTIGRGDGPDGRILSDRFLFQDNPGFSVDLAIGPNQEIAVADFFRIQVFTREGNVQWSSWGIWGGGSVTSNVTLGRVYGGFGLTYLLDGEKGTWQPESYHRALAGNINSDCKIGGQTFVVMWGPGWKQTFVRFTPEKAVQVLALEQGKDPAYQWRHDTNGDGLITDADAATPVCDAGGKPVEKISIFHHMFNAVRPDGTLIDAQRPDGGSWMFHWRCAGLDARGVPVYRWEDHAALPGADKVISPYTWKPDTQGIGQFDPRPGGGWFMCTNLTSSPRCGKSPFNNGGTDVIGVAKDGSVDWIHPFPHFLHIGGFTAQNGLCIVGHATTCDFQVLNDDGLGLPGFSSNSAWLDHVQALVSFVDQAGKINALVTDCTKSCNDWFRLEKCDIRKTAAPLTVAPATAALLAGYLANPPDFTAGQPLPTVFHVPHLKAPFAIDGDMQKWRAAGIAPQLIITPEAGGYRVDGPRDCSALFRFAWEGRNLYMQALKFDDVVTMGRRQAGANMQDTIEMAVNSYLTGIKFNFTLTSADGPVVYADGGWQYKCNILAPEHAPRFIKVLDAKDVPERALMESITGVDMSDLKIELFEAKIPIDDVTYKGFESSLWEVKPEQQFWVNFLIDDNDEQGGEAMNFIQWPIGSGTFMPKETGALAILDK